MARTRPKDAEIFAGLEAVDGGAEPRRDPEAAMDAVRREPEPEPAKEPEPPARSRRKTKNELEADVLRLTREVEQAKEQAASNSPDMIATAKNALRASFSGAFYMAATLREEPHWMLGEKEENILAEAWAPCIAMALGKHPELILWAAAVGTTYTVIAPRVMQSRARVKLALATPGDIPGGPTHGDA